MSNKLLSQIYIQLTIKILLSLLSLQ